MKKITKENVLEILGNAFIPQHEEIQILAHIGNSKDSVEMALVNAFNYGKMMGKKAEREKRKGDMI